jgi:hypothetical protein
MMRRSVIIFSLLISINFCSSILIRPDEVLAKFQELRDKSLGVFGNSSNDFAEIRTTFQRDILRENYLYYFGVFTNETLKISNADKELVDTIATETPNVCFDNLRGIINRTTEFYGYEAANCIKSRNFTIVGSDLVNEAGQNLTYPYLLLAFVGRNLFTEPQSIIDRLNEIYEESSSSGSTNLDTIRADLEDFDRAYKSGIQEFFVTCYNDVNTKIKNEFSTVVEKITTCKNFGARPPR